MTAYAVQADLEERFGVDAVLLASDRNRTGEVDASIIANAIVDAQAEIDSYLNERYTLPLSSIPIILSRLCCDIAFYRMCVDIGTLTEEKRKRYEDAVKWLTAVAKGTIGLGVSSTGAVAEESNEPETSVTMESSYRLFTRTTLGGLR